MYHSYTASVNVMFYDGIWMNMTLKREMISMKITLSFTPCTDSCPDSDHHPGSMVETHLMVVVVVVVVYS